jgi:sulfite reductase (NADPH) flavoprotein alpha-component
MDKRNTLDIIYGSRTGNAKAVAVLAYEYAKSLGYQAQLSDMQNISMSELTKIRNLMIVVSTHGEGEPPVQAEQFYELVHEQLKPVNAKYTVAGLGDSSYRYYCQTGKDIDKRLEDLGGQRLLEVGTCDIDFEEESKEWIKNSMKAFELHLKPINQIEKGFVFELKMDDGTKNAYKAELLEKRLLTGKDSSKKVLHVSLSIKNSGIEYEPGDAIGVFGTNSRLFVDHLLAKLGFDKAFPVGTKTGVRLLKDLLIHDYELTLITPLVIDKYAALSANEQLNNLIQDSNWSEEYSARHDLLDLVNDFPGKYTVEDFLSILRKLSQRLYSVASSRAKDADRVDISVKIIENEDQFRIRNGVCSSYLWSRLDVGDKVPVTLETIEKFRLPLNDALPVIMIAAGTGIAPFRAFLQEREARKSGGKNWLLLGERNRRSDFLYQDDLEVYQSKGLLNELSTAFSRDQKDKRYVSHLIEEESERVINWLNDGAIIYVCGSKNQLAKSVRQSLINVFRVHHGLDVQSATQMFNQLKANKRYQEEVY